MSHHYYVPLYFPRAGREMHLYIHGASLADATMRVNHEILRPMHATAEGHDVECFGVFEVQASTQTSSH